MALNLLTRRALLEREGFIRFGICIFVERFYFGNADKKGPFLWRPRCHEALADLSASLPV